MRWQPIPNANASPKYRRFESSHRVPRLGQRIARDDAVKATKKQGSAQRTECLMSNSIPLMEWKSPKGSPRHIAVPVASDSAQNNRQDSKAFRIRKSQLGAPCHKLTGRPKCVPGA